jgi:hypothetical protein
MKLATIALATAFALSSTAALATTSHHHKYKSAARTHQGTAGMNSRAQYGGKSTVGTPAGGWYGPQGGANLVGGADNGTRRP